MTGLLWTLILLSPTVSLVLGQLEPFLNDDGEQSLLCPGQEGTFTCTVSGNLEWRFNGSIAFQFSTAPNARTMFDTILGAASVLKNDSGALTSVMVLDPFPTTDFNVRCNDFTSEIKFSALPGDIENVATATCISGQFASFFISWEGSDVMYDVLIAGHKPVRVSGDRSVNITLDLADIQGPVVQATITASNQCGSRNVTQEITIGNSPCANMGANTGGIGTSPTMTATTPPPPAEGSCALAIGFAVVLGILAVVLSVFVLFLSACVVILRRKIKNIKTPLQTPPPTGEIKTSQQEIPLQTSKTPSEETKIKE